MNRPDQDVAQRLVHLQAAFAGGRTRLALDLERVPERVPTAPLIQLREYGYSAALLLAAIAAMPTVVGFVFRRRKWVFSMVATALKMRRWRTRLNGAPTARRLR